MPGVRRLLGTVGGAGTNLRVLAAAGVIRPYSPRVVSGLALALARWGPGFAGGYASLAVRDPHGTGLVDELGSLTFGELQLRSNALARGLAAMGVEEGDSVALMCRNHRGFVDASVAVAKLGADVLYLNTAFPGPQVAEVLERERPALAIHDEEFGPLLSSVPPDRRVVAWTDTAIPEVTLEGLIDAYAGGDLTPPRRQGRVVVLTSGTTGTPKGAPRSEAGVEAAVALLSRMPLRHGGRTHVAAPLFHTWGFAHLALGVLLGSTIVLRRSFDPQGCLDTVTTERCDALVVVPVMLQRILALPAATLAAYDLEAVRVVASSGSALPGDLATEWMDRFGDHLFSMYGSTEVAYAAIAGPEDLRAAPATAGRPPYATVVRILGEDGEQLPVGSSGRIFVGNSLLLEGYTDGGGKETVDGLMSTGDVGRFGADGRLYVEGRDDEMIVSGGENVFPQEVEDCLARHEDVLEAAAVGVADREYGERLRAFVVLDGRPPAVGAEDELKEWVRQRLARFKVPREIVFLDELPRNATGKVLKRQLPRTDLT